MVGRSGCPTPQRGSDTSCINSSNFGWHSHKKKRWGRTGYFPVQDATKWISQSVLAVTPLLCSASTLAWLMCAEPSRTRPDWERNDPILQNLDATTREEEMKGGWRGEGGSDLQINWVIIKLNVQRLRHLREINAVLPNNKNHLATGTSLKEKCHSRKQNDVFCIEGSNKR